MKISVTQDDIDKGVARRCTECPVALAATRHVGKPVFVGPNYILSEPLEWDTPSAVKEFIAAFDNGQPVKPFEFELPV